MHRFSWVLLFAACGSATGVPKDVTGVWSVTMRAVDGTCSDAVGTTRAETWTASRLQDGEFEIAVQGREAAGKLVGGVRGPRIEFKDFSDAYEQWVTVWRLNGSSDRLTGTAIEPRKERVGEPDSLGKLKLQKQVVCATIWDVVAERR